MDTVFFAVTSVAMLGWAFRVSWRHSLGIKVPWDLSRLSTDHCYALAMMLVGVEVLWWLFVTCPFDDESTSIDGGAEGWAGSADGPTDEDSGGAANGEGSGGSDLAGYDGDRGFRGGDASTPAGAGAVSVSDDMNSLISRARGLDGEAGSARQEGPVWRKGLFAAGASLQEAAPSANEQARLKGTSAGSS